MPFFLIVSQNGAYIIIFITQLIIKYSLHIEHYPNMDYNNVGVIMWLNFVLSAGILSIKRS